MKRITKAMVPRTPLARRIGAIMHRRPSSLWQPNEIKAYLLILPGLDLTDLAKIERRYHILWPPNREKNTLRHDLDTLLHHWAGEVDRANIFCEQHPEKRVRKVIQMSPADGNWDQEKADQARAGLAQFRQGLRDGQ